MGKYNDKTHKVRDGERKTGKKRRTAAALHPKQPQHTRHPQVF